MSDAAATPANTAPVAKVPIMSLLLVCLVGAILSAGACGGIILYLAKSGKLGGATKVEKQIEVVEKPATPTHNVQLEPMLVNLADPDGHAYLRLAVTLAEEEDLTAKKGEKEEKPAPGADAAVRDTILGILGSKHSAELLSDDGKEKLKSQLKTALHDHVPESRVKEVYFTEFLVQK